MEQQPLSGLNRFEIPIVRESSSYEPIIAHEIKEDHSKGKFGDLPKTCFFIGFLVPVIWIISFSISLCSSNISEKVWGAASLSGLLFYLIITFATLFACYYSALLGCQENN